MKRYIRLLPILITLGFLMLFFLPSVKGFDDIEFTFEKNTLYNNSDVNNEFFSNFNLRNQTYYDLGNYSAPYSFTNEIVGTNDTNIRFVDNIDTNASCIILDSLGNHDSILHYTCSVNSHDFKNMFSAEQTSGTIEFWIRLGETNLGHVLQLLEDNTDINNNRLHLAWQASGWLQYYDGTYLNIHSYVANNWYHIRIDFECGVKEYMGLSEDTFNIYIDGQKHGPYGVHGSPTGYECIQFLGTAYNNMYFDAIGYSWNITVNTELLDFSDDIVGNEPIGWNSDNTINCTTIIKDTLDDRTNVLELYDKGGGGSRADINTDFDVSAQVSIQADFAKTEMSGGGLKCGFYENDVNIVLIGLFDNDLQYNDGGWDIVKLNVISDSVFIVINIILDFDTDTFDLYIDGVLEGNDLGFKAEGNSDIDKIRFFTDDIEVSEFYGYIDNIYIDGIFYSIGSNIIPLTIETNYLEVDKYEFGLENPNSLYSLGHHDTVSNWDSLEIDDGTSEIIANPLNENDRMLEFEVVDSNDIGGISIINLNKSGLFFNVSFRTFFLAGLAHDAYALFNILSIPSGNIVFQLKMNFSDMILSYNNGSGYTKIDDIELNTYYDFYLFINYEINICTLDYYRSDVLIETFNSLSLLILAQSGVYSIAVKCVSEGDSAVMRLDSVGIYINSRSLNNNEYAWCTLYLGASWFSEVYNLFEYKSNGTYHLSIVQGFEYSVGSSMDTLKGFSLYNDTEVRLNIYGMEEFVVIPLVLFNIKGSFFNVSSLSAEGVILTQDTHIYYLDFEFSGVNPNVSYFYADSNNRLQFTYVASQDDVLEFIQASFNINDRDSNNTIIQFTSKKSVGAFGFFRIAFQDTSQLLQIENGIRTKRIIVSKLEIIKELVILISDTNKDTITGLTTGYISNIKLLDVEQAYPSIISLNLMSMIIPLIIIILPTMLISKLYGNFLVIPLFVMFSIILTISNMIPMWLFFVILFSSSLFIFFEKDSKEIF